MTTVNTMTSIFAAADAHRDWAVATLEGLVRLESPSDDAAALGRCASELARALAALGMRVQVRSEGGRDHLRAEIGRGDAQILLLGHYDTVWPVGQLERMPLRRDAERLYGPGAYDMKAGIAIAMLAIRVLHETQQMPAGRIVMLWTADEEVGSLTSRALIETEAQRSRAVFVLEPALPGGAVKTSRKGVGEFYLRTTGIAAHAGVDPERGASAVHELARQVVAVAALNAPERGLTINVGTIRGGSRSNVVAESAGAEVDVRIPTLADADRVAAALTGLVSGNPRVRLEVTGGVNRPPMERTAQVAALYERARVVARALGRELAEGGTGGGSDGNFTAALGIATLDGLGAEGDGAHALHEHVLLESLPFRAALLAGLLVGGTMEGIGIRG